ncbi:MAG: MFS transporter [Flavobacteriia bacterium 40-80]|nr:MAG: MFS transporter [Flavobacteriia bacterium 40-80]
MESEKSIYTKPFILMCLSSLLFAASFNMLIPDLPEYLSGLGGAEYKGFIIALFTLTAGISRPFSGKLTDRIGRIPVMIVGSMVCLICGFLYPVLTTVSGFLFLRLIHGFSTGFKPTATAAYIADIIPRQRWGEAVGLHGMAFSLGQAMGPALGSYITKIYSIETLFHASSLIALLSVVIIIQLKETLVKRERFKFSLLKIKKNEIIDRNAIPAGIVVVFAYLSYGTILTLIPDRTTQIGIDNKGLFFILFTLSSLAARFIAGKVSDKYGRIKVINLGLTAVTFTIIFIGFADTVFTFTLGGIFYGLSMGILSPALNAWTIDLSHPQHRGKAVATMYIALEIGIGGGALLAGTFYGDELSKIPYIFFFIAALTSLALIYMLSYVKDGKRLANYN